MEIAEGTASVDTGDPAPAQETVAQAGTSAVVEHTPDYSKTIEDLESNWDKIPQELRGKLDKHFQPAFNRKLNLLQDNLDRSLRAGIAATGATLPEGKTPLDLVTEDDGKGFADFLGKVVESKFAPIQQKIGQAETQQTLQQNIGRAVKDNPSIAPYIESAIKQIDQDPDLTALAMQGNGAGIYYVLQGVGALMDSRTKDAKIRELTGILEANKIAVRTSTGTTRAGSGAPRATQAEPPKTLAEAARRALAELKANAEG